MARLVELGYLDDAAFARWWVESRDRARPRATLALRRELALKGVDREIAYEVLEHRTAAASGDGSTEAPLPPGVEASDDRRTSLAPDFEAARRLLARRGPALLREPDPLKRRHRAYALLARHGFDPGTCREATDAWAKRLGERRDEGPPPAALTFDGPRDPD